jgi:hypothetical protein
MALGLRPLPRRSGPLGLALVASLGLAGPAPVETRAPQARGQAPTLKSTTLDALGRYPVYFHGQQVRVQGDVTTDPASGTTWLTAGPYRVLLHGADAPRGAAGRLQVTGRFWDIGRLQPDDSRLSGSDFGAIARAVLGREWPGPGELLAVLVETTGPPEAPVEPTVRAVALDPAHYEGKRVTLVGRFRGANLYGDLPAAPGKGRWDFVLQTADAAVWVTGLRPRGRGFDLNPQARVDTGRWLRVSGIVRHADGLVWLEGQTIELADAPTSPVDEAARVPAPPARPPAVIFSAPVPDDTDVAPGTDVRIQFSRDMDPASFEGRVRVSYVGVGDTPAPPAFTLAYRPGPRVLEIRFAAPLERFRTVRVELLEGIVAADGLPLAPWTLTFTVGAGRSPAGPMAARSRESAPRRGGRPRAPVRWSRGARGPRASAPVSRSARRS